MTADSLVIITPTQLKQTNLIFLDRDRLRGINKELQFQIDNYRELYRMSNQVDSIRKVQVDDLKVNIVQLNEQLTKQKKKTSKLTWLSGTLGLVSVTLLTLLICQ